MFLRCFLNLSLNVLINMVLTQKKECIWTHLISVSRVENDGLFGAATRCRRSRRLSNGELGLLFVEFVAFFVVFLKDYLLSVAVWIVDDLNRLSAA